MKEKNPVSKTETGLSVTIDRVTQIYSAPREHRFSKILAYAQWGTNYSVVSGQFTLTAKF